MAERNRPTTDEIGDRGGEQAQPQLEEIGGRPGINSDLEARRAAAQQSEYETEELTVEGDEVRLDDETRRQEAAEGSVYDPNELQVTDDGSVEPRTEPAPEATRVVLSEDDLRGEVAWVGPDGQRIETGAQASGDIYSAYVDVPDREGEWQLQVGEKTVDRVDVGPAGAARDAPQQDIPKGWNSNIIEVDAEEGTGSVAQDAYDPDERYSSASTDPDVVSEGDARRALAEGVSREELRNNPALADQAENVAQDTETLSADEIEQAARSETTTISDPTDLADRDDNQQVREAVAAELEGVGADEVDIVQTGSGPEAVVDGQTVTSVGSGGGAPGRQSTDATYSGPARSVGDADTNAGVTAGLEAARRQARQELAGQSDRIEEADVQTEVVDGQVRATVPDSAQTRRISDPSEVEGQTERVIENRGEVRASVNRYGQRQLDQQAISTGVEDPTPGTTRGVVDRVRTASADPEIARDLTDSGGLLAEKGNRGTPVTNATGISEQDLREPSDPILPGVLPSRQQLRRGGAGETALFRSDAEDPAGRVPDREGVGERALEGAAVAGASILNVRERAADAEQIIEGGQALPREVREEGTGDVGETLTALGRREGVQTAQRFESDPVRATSGLALDVAGGAAAVGRVPDTRDLKAEVDPRIGMFGETIESRALGLRSDSADTDADVDVDRSQTVGDQVSGLPRDRPVGLTADAVDEARGVSGPSRTSRVRGELERGIDRVRERFQTERNRFSVDTRVGAGVGSLEVRRETDTTPDSPSDFSPSRDEVLAGSPRDQIGNDIFERQRAARQQFGGDYEGAPVPFGRDRATFDPTANSDARRRAAERRFTEQDTGVDLGGDTRRDFAPDVRGGVAGGLLAGAFGRAEQAQQSTVTGDAADFADTGPVGRVDVTTAVDTDSRFDVGQNIDTRTDQRFRTDQRVDVGVDLRQDVDTRQRVDTRQDFDPNDPTNPNFDTDPNPDLDPNFDFDPRTGPELRPEPEEEFFDGSEFGFDEERFKNQISTPTGFLF